MRNIHIKILVTSLLFIFCINNNSTAQQKFSYNTPNSICYFKYIIYAPNNDYSTTKRPFVYVLGKSGETAQDCYLNDSIRDKAEFYKYKFIYIPNKGGSTENKFSCIKSFVSYNTYDYACGKSNVYLYSYDTIIEDYSLVTEGVNKVFEAVYVSKEEKVQHNKNSDITNVFKENTTAYNKETIIEKEELGSFYIVEEEGNNTEGKKEQAKKTYFGPPKAYNYTLNGIVKDKITGETLPFATILVKGTNIGVTTNMDGHYAIPKVPSDTSILIVSYVGYSKKEIFLTPFLPKKHFVIELIPNTNLLKGFTITGNREDVVLSKKEEVSIVKLTPKQIEKLPSLGEKDVMRSFQLMPGISASQESSSGLYVRGGTPDQNLILYDGFTIYHVDHLYGFFSAFNSNALKDVQLHKGGFESKFGGRLSSVTEITGKDGNQKKFNIGGDISLLSVNAFAEIPVGDKFTSIIAFRRSYQGPIYNMLFEQFNSSESSENTSMPSGGGRRFTEETTVSNYFYDLNGKFTFRPNSKNILSLSIFNGTDKLDNSSSFNMPSGTTNSNSSSSTTDLTRYGNIGTSLKWSRNWTDKLYGSTIISYSNYYSKRDFTKDRTSIDDDGEEITTSNGILENNDLKDYSFKSDYQWSLFGSSQLQFGLYGTLYDIDYTYAQNDTTTILSKQNNALLTGAYIQNKFKIFNSKLIFLPGIRASYYGFTDNIYYEPRTSLSYKLSKRFCLKTAVGKYYQYANRVTREDILSGSKDFWLLSDGNSVPVSSSEHYIAGISYENNNYLFSAEGYFKEVSNITEYSLRFNPSPSGESYDEYFYTGNSYAKGIEFLIQKKGGDLTGWASYTVGETKNYFDIYSDEYYPANQDVNHEFKLVAMYKYKRWNFSATWIYATGRPYTAPSGAYSVELLDGETQDFFTVTTKNGFRLPDYHRADISANYKLLAGSSGDRKRREIGYLGFSLFNLYNRTNVWYKTYSIEDGSIIETNVNYTGFTPNITLSLKLW